jgi:hypothetical protein
LDEVGREIRMSDKICIGCDSPKGEPHEKWCPVVTGTLNTIPDRTENKGKVYLVGVEFE